MPYEVVIEPAAAAELEDAYRFLSADSPAHAARWRRLVLRRAATLRRWPERCPLAPESDAFDIAVRHLLVGPYRLIFTVDRARRTVHVLHVRHAARGPVLI